ncbi:MAG TPA: hypothetical protein PKN75_07245 [Bacteroidia bacterium]|nr:hypothetical protein [Bacteroidia bacterium]HNU33372.1 hypothetical protein [Bacteroidia bacterium]
MQKTKLLIAILTTLCFTSCKKVKNNQADATIYVKQYKTNAPIANAKILITRGKPGSGFGTAIVDSLYTDANGCASYKKTLDEDYMYYSEAYKEKYFDTRNQQVSVTLGQKNFNTTIFMYAHSYVKLHVKNVNPVNQFDLFQVSTYCNHWYFQGMSVDTTFLYCDYGYEFMGDFNYDDACGRTKNNIDSIIYFSYTPLPHDTILVNINY